MDSLDIEYAQGLIPARAGNTDAYDMLNRHFGAHPRSRGEHTGDEFDEEIAKGSSPLARGTLNEARQAGWLARLIPARAGNTQVHLQRLIAIRAHPRSRGEHASWTAATRVM